MKQKVIWQYYEIVSRLISLKKNTYDEMFLKEDRNKTLQSVSTYVCFGRHLVSDQVSLLVLKIIKISSLIYFKGDRLCSFLQDVK